MARSRQGRYSHVWRRRGLRYRRKEKIIMTITINQFPYIEGYDGAFYHLHNEDGTVQACGIWNVWFTASASGENGENCIVIWAVLDKEALDVGDQENCCNWDVPAEVYNIDTCRAIPLNIVKLDWSKV